MQNYIHVSISNHTLDNEKMSQKKKGLGTNFSIIIF